MSSDEHSDSEDDPKHPKAGGNRKMLLERYSYKKPGPHPRLVLQYQPNDLFHCQSFQPANDIEHYHSRTILACADNGLVLTKRSPESAGLERLFGNSELRALRRSVTRRTRPEGPLNKIMVRIGLLAVQVQAKEWRLYLIPESQRHLTVANQIDLSRCARILQMEEVGVVMYRVHSMFNHKTLKDAAKFIRARFKGLPVSIIQYFSDIVCLTCLNERACTTDRVLHVWFRAGDPLSMAIQALITGNQALTTGSSTTAASFSAADGRTESTTTSLESDQLQSQSHQSMEVDSEPTPNTLNDPATSSLIADAPAASSHMQAPPEMTDSRHQLSVLAAAAASLT